MNDSPLIRIVLADDQSITRQGLSHIMDTQVKHGNELDRINDLASGITESLTGKELEVLQEMAYGCRNSEIAKRLYISEGTVKTHVHRILRKLDLADRTQAVVLAIRQGMVK